MQRIALTVALLVGGTAVAHANPPGLTPGPASQDQLGPDVLRHRQARQGRGSRGGRGGQGSESL